MKMCFDIERFEDRVDNYKCSICKKVLCCSKRIDIQSKQCTCGHIYCGKCVTPFIKKEDKKCPLCNVKSVITPLDSAKEHGLKNLKIKCINYTNGCTEIRTIELVGKHEQVCQYNNNTNSNRVEKQSAISTKRDNQRLNNGDFKNDSSQLKLNQTIRYPELRNPSYDMLIYRSGYLGQSDNPKLNKNLDFYKGKIKSQPKGDYIDSILTNWFGNYRLLESSHGYIQWLFPIREEGMNSESQPLQLHELKELKDDQIVRKRLIKAYDMMLDFFGMKRIDETGKLAQTKTYKERFANLLDRTHNNLRITRILKCLGEFEFELYQIRFLEFLIEKIFLTRELKSLDDSMTRFWIHTVKTDQERERLIESIESIVNA